ncbi:MAG: hypothetical protein JWO22_832, partial [Frankiales bacterium]|nr:hypothetical protein [Frankiales bacterium]
MTDTGCTHRLGPAVWVLTQVASVLAPRGACDLASDGHTTTIAQDRSRAAPITSADRAHVTGLFSTVPTGPLLGSQPLPIRAVAEPTYD